MKLIPILVICLLSLAMICSVRAQNQENNIKTFFNSVMPGGLTIQVNATIQTQPTGNLTLWLSLGPPQDGFYVDNLSYALNVYGFSNETTLFGVSKETVEVPIGGITGQNPNLPSVTAGNFTVPANVWGVTLGEITLTYFLNANVAIIPENVTGGFYMTNVASTYLSDLESQLNSLNESYNQLNYAYNNLTSTYQQLNQTFVQLQANYTALQSSVNELGSVRDNATRVAVILAITTIFFVATTVFLVMRRPRESW